MEIRLLLIDNEEIFRVGIRSVLTDTEFHVVGMASTVSEAMDIAASEHPDIAILEIQNQQIDGLEFLRQFRIAFPDVKVVILTHSDNVGYMERAAVLGVRDYLFKTMAVTQLYNALKNVYYNTNVSENQAWMAVLSGQSRRPDGMFKPLTPREEEVLQQLVAGKSNKEIARVLHVSADTVKEHLQHIFRKIAVSDRTQAAVWAVRKGLA